MTQEQYAQMIAQQQMAQQAQGPAMGGFMGGLLDSATAGLLPNSLYVNPQDPTNRDSAQLGGLLGMIIPALLGKWGGGALARNLATKIDPKTASGIAKWMLGAGQGEAQAANALYRQDMLGGLLGGALGGGMAEGPLGMLLGAGIGGGATYMNRASDAGELGLMKMFEKAPKPNYSSSKSVASPEPVKATVKEKMEKVYDPETKTLNLKDISDDIADRLHEQTVGLAVIDNVQYKITPKTIIDEWANNAAGEVTIKRAIPQGQGVAPAFTESETVTWQKLYDDFLTPMMTGKKVIGKGAKKKEMSALDAWLQEPKKFGISQGEKNQIPNVYTSLINTLTKNGTKSRYVPSANKAIKDLPIYGRKVATTTTSSTASAVAKPDYYDSLTPEGKRVADLYYNKKGEWLTYDEVKEVTNKTTPEKFD